MSKISDLLASIESIDITTLNDNDLSMLHSVVKGYETKIEILRRKRFEENKKKRKMEAKKVEQEILNDPIIKLITQPPPSKSKLDPYLEGIMDRLDRKK